MISPEQSLIIKLVASVLNDTPLPMNNESIGFQKIKADTYRYFVHSLIVSTEDDNSILRQLTEDSRYMSSCFSAARREVQHECSWEELLNSFERKGICIIPLKGIVIRNYYPNPMTRLMGDIDFLYKEGQTKQLKDVMFSAGYNGYETKIKHDTYFGNGMTFEAHRSMVAADTDYYDYYKSIWSKAKLVAGKKYIYELYPEDQYIFLVVHAKEHFIHGEAEFKMLMDVYLMNTKVKLNYDYIDAELDAIGLKKFEDNIRRLSFQWFGGKKKDDSLNELEDYFLGNIHFGVNQHTATMAYSYKNKARYFLYAAFPNMKRMQTLYPWLKKWPVLLPYGWLYRIATAILTGKNGMRREMDILIHVDRKSYEEGERMHLLFRKYGAV